jgi:1-deoxy-D-xylulose-5-phosphate synthase
MKEKMLESISSPEDIKTFSEDQLIDLAAEIRKRIIDVVSVTGGHLASNLGAVELTIALHKVFSSPKDTFIHDVGHQAYTHKLLTGRNESFDTLRQHKGMCGFPNPTESEHDPFYVGHVGTALPLALGVAKTRELDDGDDYVVPIIGDGTLTCGLTLEALNNIPRHLKKFIVILNDNAMAISKNVGAISSILSRLINSPITNKIYSEIEDILAKIPGYGSALAKQGHMITESLKHLVNRQAPFFEHYNLSYVGPIDGHDIKKLVDVLEAVKDSQKPVIIHVLTQKGKGMEEAMKNPSAWHGAQPFNPETGEVITTKTTKTSFPKVFGKHALTMAQHDEDVVAVTPAMSKGSCLDDFMKEYPERCIDVGIAEGHSITFSGGIAHSGKKKVFASIYSSFLQRAVDNVYIDVCLQNLPVVFCIDRAGLTGPDGATHHGIYDIGYLSVMPNMVIAQPRDGHMLKELMTSAHSWKKPVAIRYNNLPTEEKEEQIKPRSVGKGEVLAEGKDILIIALGHMCETAMQAREILMEQGYTPTIVDPVFVKPLDHDMLHKLMLSHSHVVTLEEHSLVGGLGATVNNFVMTNDMAKNVSVMNIGIPDRYVSFGGYGNLMEELEMTPEHIARRIAEECSLEKMDVMEEVLT